MVGGYDFVRVTRFSNKLFNAVTRLVPQLDVSSAITAERLKEIIKSPNSHLFVLKDGRGNIAATIMLGYYSTLSGSKAWIEDVIVDSDYRGQGLGRIIVEHALNYAKTLGADVVMLTSNPKREAANALYQKMGFDIKNTNVYTMPMKRQRRGTTIKKDEKH